MKFSRVKAAVLAGAMTLSMAVPAFAVTDPLSPSLAISSTTQLPTINMQMPTSPAIVLNPYKLSVKIDKLTSTEQIVSPVMSVVNLSDCPIQVGVGAYVKLGGSAALNATTAVAETDAKVNLSLNGEVASAAGADLTASKVSKVLASTDATAPDDLSADFKTDGTATAKLANTLAAAVSGKVSTTGKGVFNFQFTGDASKKASWTAKDTVTPTVVFKFIPLADMPTT